MGPARYTFIVHVLLYSFGARHYVFLTEHLRVQCSLPEDTCLEPRTQISQASYVALQAEPYRRSEFHHTSFRVSIREAGPYVGLEGHRGCPGWSAHHLFMNDFLGFVNPSLWQNKHQLVVPL